MCYAQPGPRCSNHASEKLARATKAYEADPSRKVLYEAMKEAQAEYDTTPAGIKQLRADGKHAQADIAKQTRAAQLNAYKHSKDKEPMTVELPDDVAARIALADDKNKGPAVLTVLAVDEDYEARRFAADHDNTSPETLKLLSEDEHSWVRAGVAENQNTPTAVLADLSDDEDDEVRFNVAQNPHTSPEDLANLAEDLDEENRAAVAGNPNTPVPTLALLTEDDDPVVAETANETLTVEVLVEHLKADYPEATTALPREWLLSLLSAN